MIWDYVTYLFVPLYTLQNTILYLQIYMHPSWNVQSYKSQLYELVIRWMHANAENSGRIYNHKI